jgi:hypothetical protein
MHQLVVLGKNNIHNNAVVVTGYRVDISASREQILAANDGAETISQAVVTDSLKEHA